jgi:hypothetical protein
MSFVSPKKKPRNRAVSLAEGLALSVMVEGGGEGDAADRGRRESVVREAVLWPYSDSFSTQYLRSQSSSNRDSKAGSKTGPESPQSGPTSQQGMGRVPSLFDQDRLRVFVLLLYSLCLVALSLWIIFFGVVEVSESGNYEVLRLCGFYLAIAVIWLSSGMLSYMAVVALCAHCTCSLQRASSCGQSCCGLCGARQSPRQSPSEGIAEESLEKGSMEEGPAVMGFISLEKPRAVTGGRCESPC